MDKNKILRQIKIKRRQLERYLFYFEKDKDGEYSASDRLKFNEEELVAPGVFADWSVLHILAEISIWENRFVEILKTGNTDYGDISLPYGDWNKWALGKTPICQLPEPEIVLAEFKASHTRLVESVRQMQADQFFTIFGEVMLVDLLDFCTGQRYDWAKTHIRRWRKNHPGEYINKNIILDRIQIERRRLDRKLDGLSDDQMQVPGVIRDWSIKDIMAHLTDWETRLRGWYQDGKLGLTVQTPDPEFSWSELDQLNQLIYAKNKDRPLDLILKEFSSSYSQTLSMIKSIPEGELFDEGLYSWRKGKNLVGPVLANTANHYLWAKNHIKRWEEAHDPKEK